MVVSINGVVVSINGVVASLVVTEFMVFATGMREPLPRLIYRGHAGTVGRNNDPPETGCYAEPSDGIEPSTPSLPLPVVPDRQACRRRAVWV